METIGILSLQGDFLEHEIILKSINPDIPIVAVTAYAFQNEKTEILKNGFADYITKPIKPGQIIQTIEKVTGIKIN